MSGFWMEFKYAWRSILGQPGLSTLVVAVLGAGLGCSIFMFSVLNAFVLAPLPFPHSEQLYQLALHEDGDGPDNFQNFDESRIASLKLAFADSAEIAGFGSATVNLTEDRAPERYDGAFVSWNLFAVLGSAPRMGRSFAAADGAPGAALTVILSDALWKSRYNADPKIIGRAVRANSEDAMVIGVMGPEFGFPGPEKVWLPTRTASTVDKADELSLGLIGRRINGASALALHGNLDAWLSEAKKQDTERFKHQNAMVRPANLLFADSDTRKVLSVLFAAVIFVLLIACANAANLLLTRSAARQQEIALRAAIGAGRARLALQGLLHSLLLASIAALLGLLIAHLGNGWMQASLDNSEAKLVSWMKFELDARVVAFALLVALATGVVTGLVPALRAGRVDLNRVLRDSDRGASGGRFGRISRILVIVEIVLSCVLLLSTGSMINAARTLAGRDIGAESANVLTARIGLFPQAYPTDASRWQLMERLVERLRAEPGVVDATIGTALPGFTSDEEDVSAEDALIADDYPNARYGAMEDHFLATYRLRLEQGRAFDARDSTDSPPVAIIDRNFAEKMWPGTEALGRRFHFDPPAEKAGHKLLTVVGVVAPVHLDQLDDEQQASFFVPLRQQPARFASLAIRVAGDPKAFATRLSAVMREVDADTPLYWVRTMDEALEYGSVGPRLLAKLFSAFGGVALVMAAAGLYGLIAFGVASRTREIGVRRSLGATDADVLGAVLGRSAWQVGLGLLLGLAFGLPFAQLLEHVSELIVLGPSTVLLVLLVLAVSAALATLVPARRALAVHPSVALRHA